MELDITEALEELKSKSELDIERETGKKWAERACAAYSLASETDDIIEKLRYIMWGEDLRHEALEHSALSEEEGLLDDIKEAIAQYRDPVLESIKLEDEDDG